MVERVFVSGAAGVIGRQIVQQLLERGHKVWAADLQPRPASFTPEVVYRQGDLNLLRRDEVDEFAPSGFIHLAATFERSTETYEFWEENFWHNVRLSHHLMGVLRESAQLRRVVFASSYLIYESALYQFAEPQKAARALVESDPLQPRNLTGMAKLAHEIELRYLDDFHHEQFTSVCARIFRGYGCGSRDVISRWIRMALDGETLTVYRPEGLFDYIYARDSAEGLIRLFETEETTGIVNLGTGRARRVADIIDILRSHFPNLDSVKGETDVPYEASCASMRHFQAATGWTPQTDLEAGIEEMVDYERSVRQVHTLTRPRSVLISSSARKVPLVRAVIDAARRLDPAIRVLAGDLDPAAPTRHVADGFLQLPRTDAEHAEELRRICVENDVGLVIPTRDGELLFWAEHYDYFASAGIDVVVSAPDAVITSIDKKAFADFGEAADLPVIPVLDQIEEGSRFVVKERFGAGSGSIGIDLDVHDTTAHSRTLEQPVVQPYVRGIEISADAWVDRLGGVKGVVLRRRNQIVDGESRVTTTYRDDRVEAEVRALLDRLPLRGPVVAQVIIDENGDPHIIELNARAGGASTASIAAGLDMWSWTLLEAYGAGAADVPFRRIEGEVRQVRVPQDIHLHDPDL